MTVSRRELLKNVISVVWLGLVGLTLISWWLGAEGAFSSVTTASVLILLIAFAKVRFIGLFFMELRHAPPPLRVIFEAWCLAVAGLIIALYLYA